MIFYWVLGVWGIISLCILFKFCLVSLFFLLLLLLIKGWEFIGTGALFLGTWLSTSPVLEIVLQPHRAGSGTRTWVSNSDLSMNSRFSQVGWPAGSSVTQTPYFSGGLECPHCWEGICGTCAGQGMSTGVDGWSMSAVGEVWRNWGVCWLELKEE